MINAQDIKKGTCIRMDGKLYFCIDFLHVKPGKGNTFMRTKLKDVVNGYVLERRFNIGEALEDVRVERRPYQYLYQEGEDYIFMNQETFEQIPIAKGLINGVDFMKEGTQQSGVSFTLRLANLARDGQVLQLARETAEKVLDDDPHCAASKNDILWRQLNKLRNKTVNWGVIS